MATTTTMQINAGADYSELEKMIDGEGVDLPEEPAKIEAPAPQQAGTGQPKLRVCHLCGEQHPLRDFMTHLDKCKKRWRQAEETKPKRERRMMPPQPQLPDNQPVDNFIPEEQLKLLNNLAMHVWKSRSLERCTTCGRTFHREQLEKHRRACHGRKDATAFGRSTHSYKSSVQAVRTSANKRAADREWEKPKPVRKDAARVARVEAKRQVPPPWGRTQTQAQATTRSYYDDPADLAVMSGGGTRQPRNRREYVVQEKAKAQAKYGTWKTTGKRVDAAPHQSQSLHDFPETAPKAVVPPPPPGATEVRSARSRAQQKPSAPAATSGSRGAHGMSKEEKMQKRIAELEQTQHKLLSYLESIENKIGTIQAEQTMTHDNGFGNTVLMESSRFESRANRSRPVVDPDLSSLSLQEKYDETPVGHVGPHVGLGSRRAAEWERMFAGSLQASLMPK